MFGLIDPKMAEKMAENENFKDLLKFLRGGGKMRIFGRAKTKDVCRSAAKICFTSSICYKVSPYQFLAKSDNFR